MKECLGSPLGDEVRRLRKVARLSQEELAERVGLKSREAISRIERGCTIRPEDETLYGFEEHIGLTRQRALELIGSVPFVDQDELGALLQQIAALPNHPARMREWARLTLPLRRALLQYSQDVMHETEQRLQEASAQLPLPRG